MVYEKSQIAEFITDIFVAVATKFLLQDCLRFLHNDLIGYQFTILCYRHGARFATTQSFTPIIVISAPGNV
jgi:hypothetical protein